jgi:DNA-binding response OmpR family regulator
MDQKHILVIDDDPSILHALESMLTMSGYDVAAIAENGPVLKSQLEKQHPHLIILDVMLSGSDGREICKRLKDTSQTSDVPIVMISAHPDVRESSLAAGAQAFLSKPFDMDELLTTISKYI